MIPPTWQKGLVNLPFLENLPFIFQWNKRAFMSFLHAKMPDMRFRNMPWNALNSWSFLVSWIFGGFFFVFKILSTEWMHYQKNPPSVKLWIQGAKLGTNKRKLKKKGIAGLRIALAVISSFFFGEVLSLKLIVRTWTLMVGRFLSFLGWHLFLCAKCWFQGGYSSCNIPGDLFLQGP